jgi:ATP synthase protein I
MDPDDRFAPPPDAPRDPRLDIPDVLTKPVKKPDYDPTHGKKSARPASGDDVRGMGRAWAIAMDFVFTIVAGALLGWGFDWWRGTKPWGVLGGLMVGFVAAFVVIVRQSAREDRLERERKQRNR